jgi:hypothetical protein
MFSLVAPSRNLLLKQVVQVFEQADESGAKRCQDVFIFAASSYAPLISNQSTHVNGFHLEPISSPRTHFH